MSTQENTLPFFTSDASVQTEVVTAEASVQTEETRLARRCSCVSRARGRSCLRGIIRFLIFLLERPEAELHTRRLEEFLLQSWPFFTQVGLVTFALRYLVGQTIELPDQRSLEDSSQ